MRTVAIASVALAGVLVGLVLWLELTSQAVGEFTLSQADAVTPEAKNGAPSDQATKPAEGPVQAAARRPDDGAPAEGARPAPPPPAADATTVGEIALLEDGAYGRLPRIGVDGRMPWKAYAAPVGPLDDGPKIAVIVTNLGLSRAATQTAIGDLPAYVTLAFSPYGEDLPKWAARARREGHEVLVAAPMEPVEYPNRDPGDKALLIDLAAAENIDRLRWMMGRFVGFVGVMGHMGSRFAGSAKAVGPILEELKARGLAYVDNGAAPRSAAVTVGDEIGLPAATVTLTIDTELSAGAIDTRLAQAERIARSDGTAVVLGFPYPVTLDRIREWIVDLEARGLSAVPVTALIAARAEK